MKIEIGDIVRHTWNPDKLLRVIDSIYWINGVKLKCVDRNGEYHKDWEWYFERVTRKSLLKLAEDIPKE